MVNYNKVSEEEAAEMRRLFRQGIGVCEIARRMKRGRRAVAVHLGTTKYSSIPLYMEAKIVVAMAMPAASIQRIGGERMGRPVRDEEAVAIRAEFASGRTIQDIALSYGRHWKTVRDLVKGKDVDGRKPRIEKPQAPPVQLPVREPTEWSDGWMLKQPTMAQLMAGSGNVRSWVK